MPTAAKLVGAILFAIIGYAAGVAYVATLPEGQTAAMLAPTVAGIGLVQGWFSMGRNASGNMIMDLGTGLRVSVQIVFFAVVIFGLLEMFDRSTRLRYDGPGEATIAAMELFLEYGLSVAFATTCLTILALGGMAAGIVTGRVARRWS
ncbi:TrgA family protein [Alterinioella nitratireducens]|uniref:TrgA family protein n=1 Tax=Alterinioella nitratireducens TaxID=2735915 RepID=UPI001556D05A|nr:TrgA family protein [Alterinioella nitratireducens]NPD20793.1 TrgA family protein [Alterinioella nitratireducens]